jgi:hypothetical protein
MSFVVEDGTGVTNANSYAAVDDFKDYHNERGNDIAGLGTSQIQKLLIKATDYIERRWGMFFLGAREFDDQVLSFPRQDLLDDLGNDIVGIPNNLIYATSEYALLVNTQELFITPTVNETGFTVKSSRIKVGPIEEALEYATGSSFAATLRDFPMADSLLRAYVLPGGETMRA